MKNNKVAALDLGSNSFRLLIAENFQGQMINKQVFQEMPRLSENLINGGFFYLPALERAWAALNKFQNIILNNEVNNVLAGGTMALRLAANGQEFLKEIERKFNWPTKILSASEEAFYAAQGVGLILKEPCKNAIVLDVGGRSTELISLHNTKKQISLNLGVVSLTAEFIKNDPPQNEELSSLKEYLKTILQEKLNIFNISNVKIIGTAGTVTTLAAMLLNIKEYSPQLINNAVIKQEKLKNLLNIIVKQPLIVRSQMVGLEERRADVIIAGLILVLEILKYFKTDEITISDSGLLEALWFKASGLI